MGADVVGSSSGAVASPGPAGGYRALMIDQGFCFNAGEWKFPDAALRGLYARNRVYENFGTFASLIERSIRDRETVLPVSVRRTR